MRVFIVKSAVETLATSIVRHAVKFGVRHFSHPATDIGCFYAEKLLKKPLALKKLKNCYFQRTRRSIRGDNAHNYSTHIKPTGTLCRARTTACHRFDARMKRSSRLWRRTTPYHRDLGERIGLSYSRMQTTPDVSPERGILRWSFDGACSTDRRHREQLGIPNVALQ